MQVRILPAAQVARRTITKERNSLDVSDIENFCNYVRWAQILNALVSKHKGSLKKEMKKFECVRLYHDEKEM